MRRPRAQAGPALGRTRRGNQGPAGAERRSPFHPFRAHLFLGNPIFHASPGRGEGGRPAAGPGLGSSRTRATGPALASSALPAPQLTEPPDPFREDRAPPPPCGPPIWLHPPGLSWRLGEGCSPPGAPIPPMSLPVPQPGQAPLSQPLPSPPAPASPETSPGHWTQGPNPVISCPSRL